MKILPNITGFAKLVYCLKYFRPYKKKIEAAKAAGDDVEERRQILGATSTWGPMMLEMFGCSLNVEGEENLPKEGPVVLVGNHQGYADIAACFAAFTNFQFGFVAKEELARIPLYGSWMPRIRSVFIKRDDPRASLNTIKEGIELLKRGYSLVIFPEGTRAKCSTPGPFMKGSLKLATKAGVPIVPFSIVSPAVINMIIHEPIPTAGISREEERQLSDRVEKIVTDGVRRLAEAGN